MKGSPYSMVELVSFQFGEVGAKIDDGDGVPKFIGNVNLGILSG